jgi:hypothetical protein
MIPETGRKTNAMPLFVILLLIAFSFFLIPAAVIAASNTTTINVSIQAVGRIALVPDFLNWSNVEPGTAGGEQTVEIQNIGSINVTNIYAYFNTLAVEASTPYGSDDASSYSSTGVIVMRNQSESNMYFNGRIEWNWTTTISNIDLSNIDDPVAWGFFKNASHEYVWAIGNGTGGLCNNSGVQFGIDDDIDDGTQSTRTPETTSFATPDNVGIDWAVFSIDRTGSPLEGHCVAVNTNCTSIYIYKYDYRAQFPNCDIRGYIEDILTPGGGSEILTLDAYIPKGIPDGNMSSSVMTVFTS